MDDRINQKTALRKCKRNVNGNQNIQGRKLNILKVNKRSWNRTGASLKWIIVQQLKCSCP